MSDAHDKDFLGTEPVGRLLFKLAVLLEHILYLDSVKLAEFERVRERNAGSVGVNVNLYKFQIAYADYRVADAHKLFLELIDIRHSGHLFEIDYEKFGTVSKFDIAQIEVDNVRIVAEFSFFFGLLRFAGDISAHFFAGDSGKEAAHNGHTTYAAGVDDARLFKHGQKFGGLSQSFVADCD